MPTLRELPRDAGFVEVADRVWVARHAWFDVNVSVVAGTRGLLVIDTHASDKAARTVLDALRREVPGDVVAVVNTHAALRPRLRQRRVPGGVTPTCR